MSAALAYILLSFLMAPAGDLAARHFMAWRRAQEDIFPPRRTVAKTIDDQIPW